MRDWPNGNAIVRFQDLVDPVVEAIRRKYSIEPKPGGVPWEGYNVGEASLVCGLCPEEALSETQLQYSEHEQGRDPLTVLVGIAVQLGIEQGRRMTLMTLQRRMPGLWAKAVVDLRQEIERELFK